jgi:serine/threonine protein kinase
MPEFAPCSDGSPVPKLQVDFVSFTYSPCLHRHCPHAGSPSQADLSFITSPQALKFMQRLPRREATPLGTLFPSSSWEAVDLLGKLLAFNPANRITAEAALQHPFFHSLAGTGDNRLAPDPVSFAFEKDLVSMSAIKVAFMGEVRDGLSSLQRDEQLSRGMRDGMGRSRIKSAYAAAPSPCLQFSSC